MSKRPAQTRAAQLSTQKQKSHSAPSFIVGVGASAGGLDAFERMLRQIPANTGMAFVLVQHLDPTHESRLAEILTRATTMSVTEAEEGVRVEPNKVYVVPPASNMRIANGILQLRRRDLTGQHTAVDFFFRSLAADQKNSAIGVILSGASSDGTQGIKAIHAAGGITFAQDAATAKYDGMPQSAIEAGAIQYILPPEQIAHYLVKITKHPHLKLPPTALKEPASQEITETPVRQLFRLLKKSFDVDFSAYKFSTVDRRIKRRMALQRIEKLENYVRHVRNSPEELRTLFHDMFIGVTEFFRDPGMFKALAKTVYPTLLKNRPADAPIRIWVPGCSTGEEVYSIAISLLEYLGNRASNRSIQIFGTDVNENAIKTARIGRYGKQIARRIGRARLQRFFSESEGGYLISKMVRDLCVFARHDIIRDPPFTRLDILSCRNLLIYLNIEAQQKLVPLFHYSLKPSGFLILGSAETIGSFSDLFTSKDRKYKFYEKKAVNYPLRLFDVAEERKPDVMQIEPAGKPPVLRTDFDLQKEAADQLILNHYGPPAVLVNENMDILHFRGHTGPFLEPAPGLASLNLLKMAREGLLQGLRDTLNTARKRNASVSKKDLSVELDGRETFVDIDVVPIKAPDTGERSYLVLFESSVARAKPGEKKTVKEAGRIARSHMRVAQLKQELIATKAYLQSVIENQEASNEALRALNEEIISSNEELRSTTEELETANEELQSSNEELNTLNEELQRRGRDLGQANDDIINLLGSMNLSILILDRQLRVRRFTPEAQKVLNLLSGDVGRLFRDIRFPLGLPGLEQKILETMESLKTFQADLRNESGRLYTLQIRPYITTEKRIEGAVLAVTDISAVEERFQIMADLLPESIAYISTDNRYLFANSAFEEWFDLARDKVRGLSVPQVQGEDVYQKLRPCIEKALAGQPAEFLGYLNYPRSGHRYVHIDFLPRKDASNRTIGCYSVKRDLTEMKETEEKFRSFVETAPHGIIVHDAAGKIVVVNVQSERMFGYSREELIGQPMEILMPKRFRRRHVEQRKGYMQNPTLRPMGIGLELSGQRKDGSEFPVEISLSPVETAGGVLVLCTIIDITERRQLAEQTRLTTIFEERGRVARDIHDTLSQGLTGIILNLDMAVEGHTHLPAEVSDRIARARVVAQTSLEQARRSVLTLSSALPVSADLAKSIQDLVERYRLQTRNHIEFSVKGAVLHVDEPVEENLLRIVQQATDNALQHARANTIRIELSFTEKGVRVEIRDDGEGFDAGKVTHGMGLTNMRDRAREIRAAFRLESQPGKGTLIQARAPISLAQSTGAAT